MTESEFAAMRRELQALRQELRLLRGEAEPQQARRSQKGPVRQRQAREPAYLAAPVQPVAMKQRGRSQHGVRITMDHPARGGPQARQQGQRDQRDPRDQRAQREQKASPRPRLTAAALGLPDAHGTVARPSVLVSGMPPELNYKVVRDEVFTHFSQDIVRLDPKGNGTWVLKFRDIETANACAQKYNMAQVNKLPIRCVAMVELEPKAARVARRRRFSQRAAQGGLRKE